MAVVSGPLPYDLDNLLGGAARVLVSDDAVTLPAIPDNISDVIDCKSPYAAKTGWKDVGATTEGTSYSREMESEGYEIEQATGAVFEEITDVSRQLAVVMGEITPEHVKIFEEAPSITTVAAATGSAAQKSVAFGSIQSLTSRRVAFIGMRNKKSGLVTEPTPPTPAVTRGRFVMLTLYSVTIAAESEEVEVAKGALAGLSVTFVAFPEGGQPYGQEYGRWLLEDAGTIA